MLLFGFAIFFLPYPVGNLPGLEVSRVTYFPDT